MEDTSAGKVGFVRKGVRDTRRQLRDVSQYNLDTFRRQPLREISGSLGDLGTLLPIMIALASQSSRNVVPAISLSTTLVFSGLANIFTGFAFGIPLPVQPMKAIASVALARDFNRAEVASAGLFVAGVIGFLSITRLLEWFTRRIPIPVIKGIQVGAGFTLVIYAGTLLKVPMPFTSESVGWIIAALLAFLALLWMPMYPRLPYALVVVLIGAVIAIVNLTTFHDAGPLRLGLWRPYAFVPSPSSFRVGALEAGLGQVPLTTLNSVIAVCFLSVDLLPNVKAPSVTAVGMSVTMMNLIGCWFGSMPVCHGSGGLAAQYRFGAVGLHVFFFHSAYLSWITRLDPVFSKNLTMSGKLLIWQFDYSVREQVSLSWVSSSFFLACSQRPSLKRYSMHSRGTCSALWSLPPG